MCSRELAACSWHDVLLCMQPFPASTGKDWMHEHLEQLLGFALTWRCSDSLRFTAALP